MIVEIFLPKNLLGSYMFLSHAIALDYFRHKKAIYYLAIWNGEWEWRKGEKVFGGGNKRFNLAKFQNIMLSQIKFLKKLQFFSKKTHFFVRRLVVLKPFIF